jgi:transposase
LARTLNESRLARNQSSWPSRRTVERAPLKGVLARGFDSDLWTLRRVALVIERLTGLRHHRSHVWRRLRAMGWTLQRPQRHASERDEEAIARWSGRTGPGSANNARRRGAWIALIPEHAAVDGGDALLPP